MIDIVTAAIGIVVMLLALVLWPTHAHCPPSWRLTRLAPTGVYECRNNLIGPENDAIEPPGSITGRIYCTGGSHPIVRDAVPPVTVGCTR